MNKIWPTIGTICFWLSWPLLYIYLKSSHRCRVIIECDQRILVVKGWLGPKKWSLPGGGLHGNEPLLDAAIREVYEEAGIKLRHSNLIQFASELSVSDTGFQFYVDGLVYHLSKTTPPTIRGLEIVEAKWLPIEQLLNDHSLDDNAYQVIQIWLAQEHLLD